MYPATIRMALVAAGLMAQPAAGEATTCAAPKLAAELQGLAKAGPAAARQSASAASQQVSARAARGDLAGARQAEEEAMKTLGYRKVWLRCGAGAFAWEKASR